MSVTVQAIQTEYRGILFRSRIEARWAVFFDALHIPYHYEMEGYKLPSGPYLPDFFLPKQDIFVEIKGPPPTDEEEQKASDLAKAAGKHVFVFYGPMEVPDLGTIESAHKHFGDIPGAWDNAYHWCECPHCGLLGVEFNGRADRLNCKCPRSYHGDKGYNHDSQRLRDAYNRARRERFGT